MLISSGIYKGNEINIINIIFRKFCVCCWNVDF